MSSPIRRPPPSAPGPFTGSSNTIQGGTVDASSGVRASRAIEKTNALASEEVISRIKEIAAEYKQEVNKLNEARQKVEVCNRRIKQLKESVAQELPALNSERKKEREEIKKQESELRSAEIMLIGHQNRVQEAAEKVAKLEKKLTEKENTLAKRTEREDLEKTEVKVLSKDRSEHSVVAKKALQLSKTAMQKEMKRVEKTLVITKNAMEELMPFKLLNQEVEVENNRGKKIKVKKLETLPLHEQYAALFDAISSASGIYGTLKKRMHENEEANLSSDIEYSVKQYKKQAILGCMGGALYFAGRFLYGAYLAQQPGPDGKRPFSVEDGVSNMWGNALEPFSADWFALNASVLAAGVPAILAAVTSRPQYQEKLAPQIESENIADEEKDPLFQYSVQRTNVDSVKTITGVLDMLRQPDTIKKMIGSMEQEVQKLVRENIEKIVEEDNDYSETEGKAAENNERALVRTSAEGDYNPFLSMVSDEAAKSILANVLEDIANHMELGKGPAASKFIADIVNGIFNSESDLLNNIARERFIDGTKEIIADAAQKTAHKINKNENLKELKAKQKEASQKAKDAHQKLEKIQPETFMTNEEIESKNKEIAKIKEELSKARSEYDVKISSLERSTKTYEEKEENIDESKIKLALLNTQVHAAKNPDEAKIDVLEKKLTKLKDELSKFEEAETERWMKMKSEDQEGNPLVHIAFPRARELYVDRHGLISESAMKERAKGTEDAPGTGNASKVLDSARGITVLLNAYQEGMKCKQSDGGVKDGKGNVKFSANCKEVIGKQVNRDNDKAVLTTGSKAQMNLEQEKLTHVYPGFIGEIEDDIPKEDVPNS